MAVLILKHPLQFGKVSITKLTIRDYTTAGDYLAFDQRGGVAQRIALVASMSGQDEEVIKQLRGPDYLEAVKIVDALFDADESTNQMPKGDEKKVARVLIAVTLVMAVLNQQRSEVRAMPLAELLTMARMAALISGRKFD